MKVAERAKNELLNRIAVKQEYHAGEKLPNENQLAQELGVSRTSVREAIQYLAAQNIVEVRRGKGTYVASNKSTEDDLGIQSLDILEVRKLQDVYEMRYMLAPQVTYFAAKRATDSELQKIISLGEKIQQSSKSSDEDMTGNREFHLAVAAAAHNELAYRLTGLLEDRLIEEFRAAKIKQMLYPNVLDDHKMIISYLKLRDAEGAKQAMALHMLHSMQAYHIEKRP